MTASQSFFPSESDATIHDWNLTEHRPVPARSWALHDDTLWRAAGTGEQEASPREEGLELLERMHGMGVRSATLAPPWTSERALEEVVAQCRFIREHSLAILPHVPVRPEAGALKQVSEVVRRSGQPLVACLHLASAPGHTGEGFRLDRWLEPLQRVAAWAEREQLETACVVEDAATMTPAALEQLLRHTAGQRFHHLVLGDASGYMEPEGVKALVGLARKRFAELGADSELGWMGHDQQGLGIVNALAALEAGARRAHGTGLGAGAHGAHTPLDLLALNLTLLGWWEQDPSGLVPYAHTASRVLRVPIPPNYPLSGSDAFRTATGVHASAIIKALKRGNAWLADRIYSAVPARTFGREQEIEIGHMSGMSNVKYWLERHGIWPEEVLCKAILEKAKGCTWTLSDAELFEMVQQHSEWKAAG